MTRLPGTTISCGTMFLRSDTTKPMYQLQGNMFFQYSNAVVLKLFSLADPFCFFKKTADTNNF